jgi:hypothetical protein
MRRNPSSGINQKDAAIILDFLLYYTKQVEADDAAKDAPLQEPSSSEQPALPSAASSSSPVPEDSMKLSDDPTQEGTP